MRIANGQVGILAEDTAFFVSWTDTRVVADYGTVGVLVALILLMTLDKRTKKTSIAVEAISGARGSYPMPELARLATYMTLAPFVGAEEAYERAMEESDKW